MNLKSKLILRDKKMAEKETQFEKIKKIIEQNPLINFILFSGFESFSDNTLQELEKGITAEQNMQALEILKELKSKYSNFNFMPSFITLTPNTRKEDLRRQIWIIKDHFLDLDLHYERFMNILLIRTKNAKKYGGKTENVLMRLKIFYRVEIFKIFFYMVL